MKIARRIFYGLTVLVCAVAIWMQVSVSGDNLLTMDSKKGYFLAVNYQWVTLVAVGLVVLAALWGLIAWMVRRKKSQAADKPAEEKTVNKQKAQKEKKKHGKKRGPVSTGTGYPDRRGPHGGQTGGSGPGGTSCGETGYPGPRRHLLRPNRRLRPRRHRLRPNRRLRPRRHLRR